MHEAYEIFSLLKLTEQIESIAAYDDNLIIATRQGHLMMYLVTQSADNTYKVQVLRYQKTFSKKPIQQIEVIPELNFLLCLSDNILVLHDINIIHFPIVQTLSETKGATLFALSNETTTSMTGANASVIRLAIVVKRKIQLYYLKNSEFRSLCVNISIPDIPKVMSWGQNSICVGFKDEYVFYSIDGTILGQFLTGSSRSIEPCIVKLSESSFLLGRDKTPIIVDESTPTVPNEVVMKVHEPLTAGAWDDPYILSLLSDQIAIHTIEPPSFIQTLSELNRARLLYKCRRGLLYVASMSQVWRISVVDIAKQRKMLIQDKRFELAIKLTNMSDEADDEKFQKLESINTLYALELFDGKKYAESMKLFIELNRNPSEVIKLFPELSSTSESDVFSKPLNDDMKDKLLALTEYLKDVRQKVQKNIKLCIKANEEDSPEIRQNNKLLELIDTTLLKCYLHTNDAFIGPLLRLNNCKFYEAEELLKKYEKYSELIILYQTNNQHKKALEFLKDQSRHPNSPLQGIQRTKTYLQQLGSEHMNLIFEFSNWVLKDQPEEGLKIFTDDILEVERFPRAKVLDFLLREHDSLVIPYLEHIIYVWKDDNSFFHNAFIRILRQKIIDKKCTDVQLRHMKSKLSSFLEKSNYYSPESVLVHFPTDSMFEERAIVLGKLDAHEQALSIYVYILGDVDGAIRYCNMAYYKANNKKNQEVYIILIRLLVNPSQEMLINRALANAPRHPKSKDPDIDTALKLLKLHADKIDPLKVLPILPDTIPIAQLKSFLEISLQRQIDERRKIQVARGLLHTENLQIQETKMNYQKQSVIIDDFNICTVCKKRFANQSAFVRYPNGNVIHYSCQDKKTS